MIASPLGESDTGAQARSKQYNHVVVLHQKRGQSKPVAHNSIPAAAIQDSNQTSLVVKRRHLQTSMNSWRPTVLPRRAIMKGCQSRPYQQRILYLLSMTISAKTLKRYTMSFRYPVPVPEDIFLEHLHRRISVSLIATSPLTLQPYPTTRSLVP